MYGGNALGCVPHVEVYERVAANKTKTNIRDGATHFECVIRNALEFFFLFFLSFFFLYFLFIVRLSRVLTGGGAAQLWKEYDTTTTADDISAQRSSCCTEIRRTSKGKRGLVTGRTTWVSSTYRTNFYLSTTAVDASWFNRVMHKTSSNALAFDSSQTAVGERREHQGLLLRWNVCSGVLRVRHRTQAD